MRHVALRSKATLISPLWRVVASRVARTLLGIVLLAALSCSKSGQNYGRLVCLEGWPTAPAAVPAAAPLSITPGLLWQTPLQEAVWPERPGVVLVGENVIASSGPGWAALDRRTGAILSRKTTQPAPPNYHLGAPAADENGTIYVESAVGLYAFGADGELRWNWGLPGAQSGEPVRGSVTPSVVGGAAVLALSAGQEQAIDLAGQTLLWSTTGLGAARAAGHWGLGTDGVASYVLDLRTGKPAGRLLTSTNRDVVTLTPLAGAGILVAERDTKTGSRLFLLDTCGTEVWSLDLQATGMCFSPMALVGTGEIAYVQMAPCGAISASELQLVAVDTVAGRIIAGPTHQVEAPWATGADGTLYTADLGGLNGLPKTRIVALSPDLRELYQVDIDGSLGEASVALSDDGVLYSQTSSGVVAVQTASPGLAKSSWPAYRHDNRSSNWAGGQF